LVQYNKHVALVVVDFQNDFTDPKGTQYIPGAEGIVHAVNKEISLCREQHGTVIYIQDWHPRVTQHFKSYNGRIGEHCVRNSWGAQLHPDLEISGDVLRKGIEGEDAFSCFSVRELETGVTKATLLETVLIDRLIKKIVFVGLATDFCIYESAIEALSKGFEVAVVVKGVCSAHVEAQTDALAKMQKVGVEIV
jgi:nicotinamidase/pyrazinamidase